MDCEGDLVSVKATHSGQVTATLNPADTTNTSAAVLINPAACSTDELLLGALVASSTKASIDCEGDIVGVKGTYSGMLTATGGALATNAAPNGDTILTTAACGSDQFIGAAGDDFTLPAPTAGCRIRFIVDANFATTSMTIVTASSANVILGAIDVNSTLVGCAGVDTVTVVNTAELKGDFVEFRSDGTSWFVSGMGATAGAITCTTAS